ncbi:unnamed protein product, partial [Ectocarpus sp. 8 AP-2014]
MGSLLLFVFCEWEEENSAVPPHKAPQLEVRCICAEFNHVQNHVSHYQCTSLGFLHVKSCAWRVCVFCRLHCPSRLFEDLRVHFCLVHLKRHCRYCCCRRVDIEEPLITIKRLAKLARHGTRTSRLAEREGGAQQAFSNRFLAVFPCCYSRVWVFPCHDAHLRGTRRISEPEMSCGISRDGCTRRIKLNLYICGRGVHGLFVKKRCSGDRPVRRLRCASNVSPWERRAWARQQSRARLPCAKYVGQTGG